MSMAGGFLGGARDRLLPASVPFRFFLAASLFQLVAWAVLFIGAADLPGFVGGPGPVLAAVHLATLGVLAMTAVGASYQLLPVATRQPLARVWPARLSFWLLVPGIALLTAGMGWAANGAMLWGAVTTGLGLAVFAVLTGDNLRRAGSLPVVAAHGWLALAALAGLVGLGIVLILDWRLGFLDSHDALARLHMLVAGFGFMGVLVMGFSLILVPMFALSRSLPARPGRVQLGLAAIALLAVTLAPPGGRPALPWAALAAATGAAGVYLWQMRLALRRAMRKRLGLSFALIRASWGLLGLTLILAAVLLVGIPVPNAPALFGFVLLAGWLLTFLTGVLQRIMPFLATMHAADGSGLPPVMSELAGEGPLKLHAACHFAALGGGAAGIVLDAPALVRTAAGLGALGAAAFAVFGVQIALRLRSDTAGP